MFCLRSVQALQNICRSVLFDVNSRIQYLPRNFSLTSRRQDDESPEDEEEEQKVKKKERREVPWRTYPPAESIRYMNSKAYMKTYGDLPVWTHYRRNFKGSWVPKTRKTCMHALLRKYSEKTQFEENKFKLIQKKRSNRISTGSPCPICRDFRLIVHYTNVKLLEQFLIPQTGDLLPSIQTGVCQRQQKRLVVAVAQAKDCGLISTYQPFRFYNYDEYYEQIRAGIKDVDLDKEATEIGTYTEV